MKYTKYKPGDKIQVRKQKYTSRDCPNINDILIEQNYMLTVKEVKCELCSVEEMKSQWSFANIIDKIPEETIYSRFEILDL